MAQPRSHRQQRIRVVDDCGRPARGSEDGLQTLRGVPTFTALQGICVKYMAEHRLIQAVDGRPTCSCRLDVADFAGWLDHVTELQASHLAMAIQEARNSP